MNWTKIKFAIEFIFMDVLTFKTLKETIKSWFLLQYTIHFIYNDKQRKRRKEIIELGKILRESERKHNRKNNRNFKC